MLVPFPQSVPRQYWQYTVLPQLFLSQPTISPAQCPAPVG
jgi:hypothetical protein